MFRTAFVRPASRLMLSRSSGGAPKLVMTTRLSPRVHQSSYGWFCIYKEWACPIIIALEQDCSSNASCRSPWFPLSLFIESTTTATADWRQQTDSEYRNRRNDCSSLVWKGKVHIRSSQTDKVCIPGKHALVRRHV